MVSMLVFRIMAAFVACMEGKVVMLPSDAVSAHLQAPYVNPFNDPPPIVDLRSAPYLMKKLGYRFAVVAMGFNGMRW